MQRTTALAETFRSGVTKACDFKRRIPVRPHRDNLLNGDAFNAPLRDGTAA